ncbi:hypothetical protein [Luteibacter yeojuensis]
MKKKLPVVAVLSVLAFTAGVAQAEGEPTTTPPVCVDTWSQARCLVDVGNGDFEAPIDQKDPYRWQLSGGEGRLAPYLGKTPDSRVLALPGKGSSAAVDAVLQQAAVKAGFPTHTYSVRLRARGSGPLPADLAITLLVNASGNPAGARELASVTRTVGWDWVPIDFRVDGIVSPAPAVLTVRITRTDNNTPTLVQVDDVQVIRTPLGVTAR